VQNQPTHENRDKLIDGVAIETDAFRSAESRDDSVIEAGEKTLDVVDDQDDRYAAGRVEIVEYLRVVELVDLVESHNHLPIELLEAVKERASGGCPAVDSPGIDGSDDLIEYTKPGVVFPAAHELIGNAGTLFAQAIEPDSCEAGLPGTGGSEQESRECRAPFGDRIESVRKGIHLVVAMLDFSRHEIIFKDAAVRDHIPAVGQAV
jgi:hypothetical protein